MAASERIASTFWPARAGTKASSDSRPDASRSATTGRRWRSAIEGELARRIGTEHSDDQPSRAARRGVRISSRISADTNSRAASRLPARTSTSCGERLEERFAAFDDDVFRREAQVDAEVTLAEIDREFVAAHEMIAAVRRRQSAAAVRRPRRDVVGTREFATDCCELTLERRQRRRAAAVLWPSAKALAGDVRWRRRPAASVDCRSCRCEADVSCRSSQSHIAGASERNR